MCSSDLAPPPDYHLPPPESGGPLDTATATAPADTLTDPAPVPAASPVTAGVVPADPPAGGAGSPSAAPPVEPVAASARVVPGLDEYVDYPFRLALVAGTLFGVAVAASQFPYGRIAAAALAGVGLGLAGLSLAGLEGRKWVGWAGVGLNALALLLVLALPGWLGTPTWVPDRGPDSDEKPVTAVGRDGTPPRPAEWVNASQAAWQHDDVRVAVAAVTSAPVESAAKTKAKPKKQDRVLRVELKVTNVGVARAIEFAGWPVVPPGEPVLTTAGGKVLAGRQPGEPGAAATLYPGRSADWVLVFDDPAEAKGDLRLELPAQAYAGTNPVRLLIPRAMIFTK